MKLSRYNIEKKEDKSCLIYNTVVYGKPSVLL